MIDSPPRNDAPPVLLVGASVRALAESARRAGFAPWAIDYFGDEDLRRAASTIVMQRYPYQLLTLEQQVPSAPWCYTGGIENYPRLVETLSRARRLWGVAAPELRLLRDPTIVRRLALDVGLTMPESTNDSQGVPTDGSWLVKRRRSAAGLHVRPWRGDRRLGRGEYLQPRVEGPLHGALYLMAEGRSRWIGASRGLVDPTADAPYRYSGSVGPVTLSPTLQARLERLGQAIAAMGPIAGWIGVDVLVQNDTASVLEINPRWTASVELFERAGNFSAFAWQHLACVEGRLPDEPLVSAAAPWVIKQVLYAPRAIAIDARLSSALLEWHAEDASPTVADLPVLGTRVEVDQPLLTVLAWGASESDVERAKVVARARLAALLRRA